MFKKNAICLALTLLFSLNSSFAEEATLSIDTEKSKVAWVGKKVTGQHNGVLKLTDGVIQMDGDKLQGGSFKLAMSSIENKDLEDPEYKAKLENHLKSDDFFNVSKFPIGEFKINRVTYGNQLPMIDGTLTVKGISKDISFPANIEKKGDSLVGTADVKIDRTNWDIRYNSGKFFDPGNLGDKLIYDDIEISLMIVATPKS